MDNYKPIVGKIKVKMDSSGGSFNADQFREKYQGKEKAYYDEQGLDAFQFGGTGEYLEKKSRLSFDMLRAVAKQVAPIGAIINTRIDQVATFAKPSRYNNENIGFNIRLRDMNQKPTEEEQQEMLEIEDFIQNCGAIKDRGRDNFETFLRKGLRDSLTLDALAFEIIRKDNGQPYEMLAIDGATIRSATEEYEPGGETKLKFDDELDRNEEVAFVQVIDNEIVAWFTDDEIAYATRNPTTDVKMQPYGLSEIEIIVKQLSSYIESEDYNMRFFQQGGMTKGILNIAEDPSGVIDRRGLESFKRQWRTQVTGQKGAWKIPVFQLPGKLEFINMQQSNGEMVFEKWINYLINIICAVYRIDPAEINFPNNGGVGGRGNSLFSGEEGKYKQSQDKGLLPLLQFIENTMNQYIVSSFSDKYIFVFEGVNEKTEEAVLANDRDKVSNFMTLNELRLEKGMAELEHGDIVLNPYYMQMAQSGGGDMGGMGDAGGFDFYEDGEDEEGFDFGEDDDQDNDQDGFDEGEDQEDEFDKAILSIEIIDDLSKSRKRGKIPVKK